MSIKDKPLPKCVNCGEEAVLACIGCDGPTCEPCGDKRDLGKLECSNCTDEQRGTVLIIG